MLGAIIKPVTLLLRGILTNVTSNHVLKYDCDDCRYYPCAYQAIKGKGKKIIYNQCGDHSERGTP